MITKFRQKMVTIKISDHHLDNEEMRTSRLYQATKWFGEKLIEGINKGHLKSYSPEISACMLTTNTFGDYGIHVIIYGVPKEKREFLISMFNCWHLNNHYPHNIFNWFNDNEIALNVSFVDGNCSDIYSRTTLTFHS